MKKIIPILTVVVAFFVGCAEETPDIDINDLAKKSFDAWIAKNVPNAVKLHDGYIDFIERTTDSNAKKPADTSWVMIDYTGRTLDGTVFVTRNEEISRKVNKWSKFTHWADKYTTVDPEVSSIGYYMREGIKMMAVGDSAIIYVPTSAAYYSSDNTGYDGEVAGFSGGYPILYEVKLNDIIDQPAEHELEVIAKYAEDNFKVGIKDSVLYGVYMNVIESNGGNYPKNGDTVSVHLTEFFLDDFVITTTSKKQAKEYNIYSASNTYAPFSITFGETYISYKKLLEKVAFKMRVGDVAMVATISDWTGVGYEGDVSSTPQVDPFTPRLYRVEVFVGDEDEEDESEE